MNNNINQIHGSAISTTQAVLADKVNDWGTEQLIDGAVADQLSEKIANLSQSVDQSSFNGELQEIFSELLASVPYEVQDELESKLGQVDNILSKMNQNIMNNPGAGSDYAEAARVELIGQFPEVSGNDGNSLPLLKGSSTQLLGEQVNSELLGSQNGYTEIAGFSSDLITSLLGTTNGNVSILLISMIVFLALADIDSAVIQTDATLITANQAYQKQLAQASSALQALESVLPYVDSEGNNVDDLYTLYQIAYGGGDYEGKADDNLKKSLEPFTDWLKATDGSDMDSLISNGFPSDSNGYDQFQNALNTAVNTTNQALAHVGATTMPLFSYDSNNQPIIDVSKIQVQVSDLSSGMTAASSISQQENVIFQSHNEALNQHLQAAVNCLSTYKNINQRIWAQQVQTYKSIIMLWLSEYDELDLFKRGIRDEYQKQ